jgi:hypothetical protein
MRIDGHKVLVYRFPRFPAGGMNGSHWAAFVTVGNYTVFASLHGKSYVDAAIQMALDLAGQVCGLTGHLSASLAASARVQPPDLRPSRLVDEEAKHVRPRVVAHRVEFVA